MNMSGIRWSLVVSLMTVGCALPAVDRAPDVLSADVFIEASYDSVWRHLTSVELQETWHTSPGIEFSRHPRRTRRVG